MDYLKDNKICFIVFAVVIIQQTNIGFDFDDHSSSHEEIEFQTKCLSDNKRVDESLQQEASRRWHKAKDEVKFVRSHMCQATFKSDGLVTN